MSVGTWNVQGITRKTNEIITELKELNIYLAVLAETKRKGSKIKVQDVRICRGPVYRSDQNLVSL